MEEMEESSIVLCKPGRHSQWHRHLRDVKKNKQLHKNPPKPKKGQTGMRKSSLKH